MDPRVTVTCKPYTMHIQSSNHGGELIRHLQAQRETDICKVTVLSSEKKKFRVHRCILAAHSTVLAEKLKKYDKCVTDIKNEVLEIILDYLYTGDIVIREETSLEIYTAALALNISSLVVAVRGFFYELAGMAYSTSFLESSLFLRIPPDLMRGKMADVMIELSQRKRYMTMQFTEALAKWVEVSHEQRWTVYKELLERSRNAVKTNRSSIYATPKRCAPDPPPKKPSLGPSDTSSVNTNFDSSTLSPDNSMDLPCHSTPFSSKGSPDILMSTLSMQETEIQNVIEELNHYDVISKDHDGD